jgi:hypothetical protein
MSTSSAYYGDNKLYVCGSNYYGQLGLGDFDSRHSFELLMEDPNIASFECKYERLMIVKKNKNNAFELWAKLKHNRVSHSSIYNET